LLGITALKNVSFQASPRSTTSQMGCTAEHLKVPPGGLIRAAFGVGGGAAVNKRKFNTISIFGFLSVVDL
jgi:hypothetical protein